MSWWEILIVIAIVGFTLAVIVTNIIKRKQGKPTSCGDCSSCGYNCHGCGKDKK